MLKRLALVLLCCCSVLSVQSAFAAEPQQGARFQIEDIRVEGLQRVSAGSLFAALPLNVGDTVGGAHLQDATRSLFKTGFFDDIQLSRDGNVLIVTVVERPSVAKILLDGNKAIETEQLMEAMNGAGLAEGMIFKRAVLDGMALELQRQYVAQGRYGASVKTDIEEMPGNRVTLHIDINEGKMAAIKHINIVGNKSFAKQDLLDMFEQETSGFWSWMNNKDKYSKEKLQGDIERLESFYLDRGYLRFKIDSTQVSLSTNKKSIYITVNISEGEIYTINKIDLAGELIVPEAQIRRLILLRENATFSQVLMTTTSERITQRLGNEGYTFAEVEELTEINDEDHNVDITFYVNPEERTYVRRIDFRGNTKTADDVLRREMRQMEGASASTYKIEQSRVRLQRLGYFKSVEMDKLEVPGTGDQIDLEYSVEEQPSGSIGASIGFAQDSGVILGANIQQNNFLGTGKKVGFNLSTSDFRDQISLNYTDPYYTVDGVSRGFSLYYVARDLDEVNISSYSVDTYGLDMTFGYPISEIERVSLGLGYSHNDITVGGAPAQEISGTPTDTTYSQFVTQSDYNDCVSTDVNADVNCTDIAGSDFDYDLSAVLPTGLLSNVNSSMKVDSPQGFLDEHGTKFNAFMMTATWKKSTLNRGTLATRGKSQSVSAELAVPGSDLQYWKANYRTQYFRPLTRNLTLRLRGRAGLGDGYGNTSELPFYEHFYGGGFGSVRGFKRNTLGPHSTPAIGYIVRASKQVSGVASDPIYVQGANGQLLVQNLDHPDGDPFGGNVLLEGSMEVIFPMPFVKDQRSMQPSVFLDVGNVFDLDCGATQQNCYDVDLAELRYSVGVGLTWITGFGPLTFSLAKPFNDNNFDETETFQFSLGQLF